MANEIEAIIGKNPSKSVLTTLDALRQLQSRLRPYTAKLTTGMHYGEEIKYASWTFDPSLRKRLELLHLTDLQFGHREAQYDRMVEYRDWVLSQPNRFVLFGGDMVDSATVFSPGEPWENFAGPQRQLYKFVEWAAPLRHRILGFVGGNHERRGVKTFGDLGILIASLLRVPYSGGRQLVDVHFGSHHPFHIDLWHGRGASRTKGQKVMMLWNYVKDHPGSDLYLCGHLHDCFILPFHTEARLPGRNNVRIAKHYAGMSSSFLNSWGTYAEVSGMSITDVLMLRCLLESNGHSEVTIR